MKKYALIFFCFILLVGCSGGSAGDNSSASSPDETNWSLPPSTMTIDQSSFDHHLGELIDEPVIQSFESDGNITMVDVLFATWDRINDCSLVFYLRDNLQDNEDYLVKHDFNASELRSNNWYRFSFSPVRSEKGNTYYVVIKSENASPGNAVTIWASSENDYGNGRLYYKTADETNDIAFRVFTEPAEDSIEYTTWLDITPDYWDRKIYRSRYSNISMSFGDRGIMEGFFYEHFLTYPVEKMYDYFCIPDDLIISYTNDPSDGEPFDSWVRAYSLLWTVDHGLYNNAMDAFLTYRYHVDAGFNPLAYTKGNGIPPRADIEVTHEMNYSNSYIPMRIKIRNRHDRALRYLYVFQDGAYMTQGEANQMDVHQYWDDGEYEYSRVWYIDDLNRNNKNNWVAMYNDRNGKMCAATYAPPESKGIRYHATWNQTWMEINNSLARSVDPFGYQPIQPDWYKFENLLANVDALSSGSRYDNNWKWHGTIIDFGVLQPGEEREQVIVKILFTGYLDRADMHARISNIIQQIPKFDLPEFSLPD